MSGMWNNQSFQSDPPGQVKLFDPTKFQTPMSVPGTQAAFSSAHQTAHNTAPTTTQSSWNSWSSWDWNGDNTDAGTGMAGGDGSNIVSSHPWGNQQQLQPDGTAQIPPSNEAWNNTWDGAGIQQQQYQQSDQQYQAYDQPATAVTGMPYEQGQQFNQQPSSVSDQMYYGTHQYYTSQQFYNQVGQQEFQSQEQQQQQASSPQHYQQQTGPEDSSLMSQTYNSQEQSYSQYQPYQQGMGLDQGHQQQQQQHQGYYDQPTYQANSWNPGASGGEQVSVSQHQAFGFDNSRNSVDQSPQTTSQISQPQDTSDASQQQNVGMSLNGFPRPDVLDDHDNDGTVSGFFGKDDDGDVAHESPRLGLRSSGSDTSQTPAQQSLPVHNTASDISNTSQIPQDGEEGDGDPLHHVQELVQRMEQAHIAQHAESNQSLVKNFFSEPSQNQGFILEDSSNPPGVPPSSSSFIPPCALHEESFTSHIDSEGHGVQEKSLRGDFSGFGSDDPDFIGSKNSSQPTLPLEMDLRPTSPDNDDHPGSGGSGASGGSSGLADWEIVPSQASSGPSHSRNSSLDNGVSTAAPGFTLSDKPDGGMISLSSGDTAGVVPPPVSGTTDGPPLSLDTSTSCEPSNSTVSGSLQNHHSKNVESALSIPLDSTQAQLASSISQPVSKLGLPPSQPSSFGGGNSESQFRQETSQTPHHAGLVKASSSVPTALPPTSFANTKVFKEKTYESVDKERGGLAALPSRPKPPQPTSTDDGIPARRRDPDRSSDSTISNSVDQDPSSQSPRRQSAFHPVSRPRHTAPSPALWDQADAPSSNILLAPAMPLIIPNLNSQATSDSGPGSNNKSKQTRTSDRDTSQAKEDSRKYGRGRREEDPNRSIDSLDEIDSPRERDRSYRGDTRERDDRYRREGDRDRPSSRVDRPYSRTGGQYHYDRDRPSSRAEGYGRDDPYRRTRAYYRDYGDLSYDERYDRPRSRQDESRGSRPTSRTGQQEVDRPRSRANYDRDRDYYGRGERNRGYGYDPYYEERERYYRYYREKEARYARGYYEEYYGANGSKSKRSKKQAEQYLQRHQQKQHQQGANGGTGTSRSGSTSRQQSRGTTPAMSGSRGNTPAAGAPSPGPEYYGRHGSRPASRADYNRDYYHRGYDYSGYYYDGYGYDPYAYGYNYSGYQDPYNQSYEQERLTPPKYSYPHMRACFGPGGQLVKVLPNRPADGQPATVELQDVQSLLQDCPEAEELRKFPGPLSSVNTHKKDVLLFCQQKAKQCGENVAMTDRESARLIWKLLELLIKQNGSVVGTDLSDLLLEGHEPSTHEFALHGLRIAQSESPASGTGEEGRSSSALEEDTSSLRVAQERTMITPVGKGAEYEREARIDRFRHLLLYGRKKDALECAMKNNLWGHALFLASKMDSRTHANVMTRFANSAMRMNDPLQTLYQLMSNRQPAAVTCVADERWGDWRPHLAMMLSNQTSRSDVDRKSICTLGDTLASKGYLHASHFCYLMAQVTLGTYFKKTSKIVLLGSSHTLPMDEFATTDAIQCTEVYEYAQLLGNQAFCIPHFQIYKYLYACQLADYGMAPEALFYCEVIASNIQKYPAWFKPAFIKLVYQLSSKLKFSDPQRLHTSEDAEDPVWMQQLCQISAAFEDGSLQPVSGTVTPANFVGGTTASSESGDFASGYYGGGASAAGYGNTVDTSAPAIDTLNGQQVKSSEFYTSQQPGAENVDQSQHAAVSEEQQYNQQQLQQNVDSTAQYDYSQQNQEWNNYLQWQQNQQQQLQPHDVQGGYQQHSHIEASQHYHPQNHHLYQQHQQPHEAQQQQQVEGYNHLHYHQPQQYDAGGAEVDKSSEITADDNEDRRSSIGGGSQYDASSASSTLYGQSLGAQHPFPQGGLPPRASITTNETTEDEVNEDEEDEDNIDASAAGFDYFGNVSGQIVAPPHRYRTQSSGSSTGGGRRRRTTSGSSTGSVKAAPGKSGSQGGSKPPSSQATASDDKRQGQPGSGWFGGLWSKLGRKGKNEMILPDDKDPAIVWDSVKNKWVNSDGTEEEVHSAAPPPKDTELMTGNTLGAPPPSGIGAGGGPPPPPANAAATTNRFSLKAKGARNQYVDVNNPKPMAVPSNLFNVMPGAPSDSTTQPQVYMPGSAPQEANSANTNNSNPGLLSVPENSDQLSRTSSMSSLSHEVRSFMEQPPVPEVSQGDKSATMVPPQMPMLFNPASLKTSSQDGGQQMAPAGPGLKYGQRRAYPK